MRRRPGGDSSANPDEALALGTTRPRDEKPADSRRRFAQAQVFASAALCSLGAALGLLTVLRELGCHVASPNDGVARAIAALCLGTVLGLWIPRRVLRRRLADDALDPRVTSTTDSGRAGRLRHEFAASLTGTLMVVFALLWVAVSGGALFVEDYRAFLVQRFAHPAWVTRLLLTAPLYIGLVFAGGAGTTLLIALHGWCRLITQPNTRITWLWTSILGGALAAGLLGYQVARPPLLALAAPLSVFAAAVAAVLRRADSVGRSTRQPAQRALTRDDSLVLLKAALAGFVVGTALYLATPGTWDPRASLGLNFTVLTGAACLGLFLARGILRARVAVAGAPLALLLAAVALLLPYGRVFAVSIDTGLLRLAFVTSVAAICVVLAGRRIGTASGSVQYALSWIGRSVASGFGLAVLLLPACILHWGPAAVAMGVAILATVGAGVALVLDRQSQAAIRVAGLIGIGVWLFSVPGARRASESAWRVTTPRLLEAVRDPLAKVARGVAAADSLRSACVSPDASPADKASIWNVDLVGPPVDIVIVAPTPKAASGGILDPDSGRRLRKRISTRLVRKGRLLIELPTSPPLAAALDGFNPEEAGLDWTGHRIDVRRGAQRYAALIFGRDIPALIERQTPLPGMDVSLKPLRGSPDAWR